jgi:hypothetical protein
MSNAASAADSAMTWSFRGEKRITVSLQGEVRPQSKKSNRRSFDSSACRELAQDDRRFVRI